MTYEEHVAEIARATDAVNLAHEVMMAAVERKDLADRALTEAKRSLRRHVHTDVVTRCVVENPLLREFVSTDLASPPF